ncbi:serine hydrolase domain-containing protein [Aquirufa ecclesiirivi]
MKKHLLILLLFCISFSHYGQVLSPSIKPHPSIDNQRLAYVDTVLKQYVDKNWLTGAVTIVIKDNQVVHYKGHGYADVASKKPMPADAIFRIMSQTKGITSAGIMQLYEKGKFSLDQSIGDFIPEFKKPKVIQDYNPADTSFTFINAKREITFRDLLTHSSGLGYADIGSDRMKAIYAKAGVPSGLGTFRANLLEKMKILGKLPLEHQPGEKFTYGLNTDLLGCLIEVISGQSLEEYLQKNIFDPLGMKDTYFNVPAEKASRLPSVYTEDAQKNIIAWAPTFRNINPNYPLDKKSYFSGGAGLSSTAFDYAIFLQMLLNGGKYNGKQIFGRRTVELMISPQLDFIKEGADNFGLGFSITSERSSHLHGRNKGSFNWGGYYGTTYWVDPKENMICLIMTQHTPNSHGDYSRKVENIIYSSLLR